MKKFVRIFSLVIVAVMLCATLASCGGPAKDPKDAAAALKANGYTVAVETDVLVTAGKDGEHITINYCSDEEAATKIYDELVANQDKAQEKLDEAKDALKAEQDKLDEMEDGAAKTIQQGIVDLAKKAVEEAEKLVGVEIGKSGNMVWVGTAEAIKAAK